MIALFNIFMDVKLHNVIVPILSEQDVIFAYAVGGIFCIMFSLVSFGFHIHDFYDQYRFNRSLTGNIKAILLILVVTFLLEYLVLFMLIQNPILPLSAILFFLYYIVRFIWRLASIRNSGMFAILFDSMGYYYNEYEQLLTRKNNNKKEYLRYYNNKLKVKYI